MKNQNIFAQSRAQKAQKERKVTCNKKSKTLQNTLKHERDTHIACPFAPSYKYVIIFPIWLKIDKSMDLLCIFMYLYILHI